MDGADVFEFIVKNYYIITKTVSAIQFSALQLSQPATLFFFFF